MNKTVASLEEPLQEDSQVNNSERQRPHLTRWKPPCRILLDLGTFRQYPTIAIRWVLNFSNEEKRLDVLICNAGIAWTPELLTEDGHSTVVQVNYLSHLLLANLLLDKLKQSPPNRIVFVASDAHRSPLRNKFFHPYLCSVDLVIRSIEWLDAFTQFHQFRLCPRQRKRVYERVLLSMFAEHHLSAEVSSGL